MTVWAVAPGLLDAGGVPQPAYVLPSFCQCSAVFCHPNSLFVMLTCGKSPANHMADREFVAPAFAQVAVA